MNLLIKNIKQLVTVNSGGKPYKTGRNMRELGIIEHATVLIENGVFKWIGPDAEFTQTPDENIDTIDASDYIALPGFVDSHTNALFAESPENETTTQPDEKIFQDAIENGSKILKTVLATRAASKKDLIKSARCRLESMLQHGTTTVEIKSGYGLNDKDEIKMLEVINDLAKESLIDIIPTFFGAHAVPPEFKNNPDDYVDIICNRLLPYIAQRSLAKDCDAVCEQGYFSIEQCRKIFQAAKSFGINVKLQADQFSNIGSAAFAAEIGAVSVGHLNLIDNTEISALKKSITVATILPGVSFFQKSEYAPARKIIDAEIPLAIASGFNPVSCMSYSMPLMMTIACTQMNLTPEEAISAATLNGAAALGLSSKLGSIEVDKQADIILFDVPNYRYLVRHFGINHAVKIIKRGIYLDF